MPTQAELIRSMKERVYQVKERLDPQLAEIDSLIKALSALTGEPHDQLLEALNLNFLKQQVVTATQTTTTRRSFKPRQSPRKADVWRDAIKEQLKKGPTSQKNLHKLLNANSGSISVVVRQMIDEGELSIVGLDGRSRVISLAKTGISAVDGPSVTPPTPVEPTTRVRRRHPQRTRTSAAVKEMIRTFLRNNPTGEFTNKEIADAIGLRERQVYHKLVEMREGNPPEILRKLGEKAPGGLGLAPNLYRINPEWTPNQ